MFQLLSARVLVLCFLLCAAAPLALAQSEFAPRDPQPESALDARVALLEQEVQELRAEVAELRQQKSAAPSAMPAAAPAATPAATPAVYEVSLPSEELALPTALSSTPVSTPASASALPQQIAAPRTALLGGATLTGSLDL